MTARLGEILYERENAQEVKTASQGSEAASEAISADPAAPSKEAMALEAALKKARRTLLSLGRGLTKDLRT